MAFRGRDGPLFGHCLSDRSSQVSLESLLEACADNPAGDAQYLQWRVHEENQWGQRVARVMGVRLPSGVAHKVLPVVEQAVQAVLPCEVRLLAALLQAPIASHVVEVLAAYGFSDNIQLPLRAGCICRGMWKSCCCWRRIGWCCVASRCWIAVGVAGVTPSCSFTKPITPILKNGRESH